MKIAKISLIAALALGGLLACTNVVTAQDAKKGRGMNVEQRMERLTTELTLTDAQKPKVKAVLEDSQKKMQELRGDTNLSQEQRREKMTAMREEETKKMKEILTPEQFGKYEKLQAQMRQNRGGGQGGEKKAEKKTE